MSLRSKIIWLFCGFSVVPILIVAAFSYWQVNQHVTEVLGPDTTSLLLPALKSLHITYWLFVIGLAGSTVLAFSVFPARCHGESGGADPRLREDRRR